MKRLLPALVAMLLPFLAGAQVYVTTEADSLLAVKVLQRLERNRSLPTADLVHQAANALMGQTYVANTLNEGEGEQLRIFLTRTDCIIFVETCFALARTAKEGGDFRRFAACVLEGRYRDGVVTRFEDRIHYTTENFRRACRRGTLKDMSRELGGEIFDHPINFMSTHPGSYPLMTAICRGEYGFNGCYITDYPTTMKGKGSDMYLAAGGNLVHATAEQTLSDVKSGWCRALIREAVHGILYNTANSIAMNGRRRPP